MRVHGLRKVGKFKNISAGKYTCFAVDDNNKLWASGMNISYLGVGCRGDRTSNVFGFRSVEFPRLSENYILAAGNSCFYVYDNNKLYGCGLEVEGRLGGEESKFKLTEIPADNVGKIMQLYCGSCSVYAINDKRQLFSCGSNSHG
jgi:alpha-tubulin suppressor-like RCC1 family protein